MKKEWWRSRNGEWRYHPNHSKPVEGLERELLELLYRNGKMNILLMSGNGYWKKFQEIEEKTFDRGREEGQVAPR